MPRARRHVRHDEAEKGVIKYLLTNVEYAHDGIANLKDYVPMAQGGDWVHDGTANHAASRQYDAGTSRIMERITSSAAGTITSIIRKRLLLPRNFGSFPVSGFSVIVRGSAILPTSMRLTVLKGGVADATVNLISVKPTVGDTFEAKNLSITSTYAAGDLITLEFDITTDASGRWGEIGDFEMRYLTSRGNV